MKYFASACIIFSMLTSCTVLPTVNQRAVLKRELAEMVVTDQIAASMPQGEYKKLSNEEWKKFQDSVFISDKNRIKKMFRKHGFLGFDYVGQEGSTHFWLLVQHSDMDPDFQREVLRAMDKAVKKNNANPNNYALLFDRVQVNAGKKQKFGSQVTYDVNGTGRAFPKIGLIDSLNVDKLRVAYKLDSLHQYLNMMTSMHFEMNKERYLKLGIKEPYQYKP